MGRFDIFPLDWAVLFGESSPARYASNQCQFWLIQLAREQWKVGALPANVRLWYGIAHRGATAEHSPDSTEWEQALPVFESFFSSRAGGVRQHPGIAAKRAASLKGYKAQAQAGVESAHVRLLNRLAKQEEK